MSRLITLAFNKRGQTRRAVRIRNEPSDSTANACGLVAHDQRRVKWPRNRIGGLKIRHTQEDIKGVISYIIGVLWKLYGRQRPSILRSSLHSNILQSHWLSIFFYVEIM